jgi:branched-chain amino acid transport system substrate-binding protein
MHHASHSFVAAFAALSLLAACGGNGTSGGGSPGDGASSGTLTIGYLGTLSGPTSFLGEAPRQGAALAVKQINGEGGVCGYQLAMKAEDDQLDPAKGVAAVQKLVNQDRVAAVVGAAHSGVSLATLTVTEQAKVPQISPLSALNDLTDPVRPYFFRLWNKDAVIARTLAEFAAENYERVGLLYETTAFGQGGKDALSAAFEDVGGALVGAEAFDLSAQDLTPQLSKLRDAGAEAVIVQSQGPQAALTARNLRQLGYDAAIIGHPGLAQEGFVKLSQGAADGAVVIDGLDRDKPAAREFITAFEDEYGAAPFSFYPATGYDAVRLIAAGLENAGCDPGRLQAGLEQVDGFTGVVGSPDAGISFSADDHDGYGAEALLFKTIRDGQLVTVDEGRS